MLVRWFVVMVAMGALLGGCLIGSQKRLNRVEVQGEPTNVEVSFGTSQLFDSEQELTPGADILPTTSALFIGEYALSMRWNVVGFFNLPLSSNRTITEDGRLKERFAAPALAVGALWTPLIWDFRPTSRLELQTALLGGWVTQRNGRFFPLGAVRLHMVQDEGFALYVGTAVAFRIDTAALIYGVGHRF